MFLLSSRQIIPQWKRKKKRPGVTDATKSVAYSPANNFRLKFEAWNKAYFSRGANKCLFYISCCYLEDQRKVKTIHNVNLSVSTSKQKFFIPIAIYSFDVNNKNFEVHQHDLPLTLVRLHKSLQGIKVSNFSSISARWNLINKLTSRSSKNL